MRRVESVKHRLLDNPSIAQMLDDDSLQQLRRDAGIPNPFGVDDDDRAARAHAEARGLATLHAARTEQQAFALQERRQHGVERSTTARRRTEVADTNQDVS